MKKIKILIAFIFILVTTACSITVNEDMITSPSKEIDSENLRTLQLAYRPVELLSEDGSKLFALEKSNSTNSTTVVIFHGNALNLTKQPWFGVLNTLSDLNVNVLAIDYRGFGKSEGKANFTNMKEDAITAIESISKEQDIFLYGLSLGSVMAAETAKDPRVKGLIIEGGITNETDMIDLFKSRKTFGSLFSVELDENLKFDIPNIVEQSNLPLLVIHGLQDENIPASMGKSIFAASSNPDSDLYLVEDGGHCDTFSVDRKAYLKKIDTFINTVNLRDSK
ncbi:alpha/beta hydrolase [Alteromonas sp. CI.11.F.A3]|uniref:alpha/beta hydrolase n=1 Tax=Alteromonas sp. CI.11.F.A3 TaxID=3079555 RepID=UPI0029421EF8|nr:alpha/beta hydrolase [Alteromonas sp. CI.11.F.A3]WOI38541.1 alpha/beta hydrolase [Alteromonas sp. CI.11.F.A3]